jgi:hypothetical protein
MSEEFNKKIAKDFGLENMDTEEQERMIEKIGNLLFESVIERAVDVMDEATMNDFDSVITNAGSDYQKLVSFLKERVAGFDKIVTEELSRLKRATSHIFK